MLNKIKKTVLHYRMIESRDIVIAAVSGGQDSICLLDVLDKLKDEMGFGLEVAHFEHGIRGENSIGDAEFVRSVADERGLKLHMDSGDVPEMARERKMSIEEAAREARYAFFERLSAQSKAGARVALGHTATDQAETVLMRLLRGSGLRGLGAIPNVRGIYIRPLIEVTSKEIVEYLENNGLTWREDETNLSKDALRNRIRQQLIPQLEKEYNPRLVETLNRTADASRSAIEYLDILGEEIARNEARQKDGEFFLPRKVITDNHPAVITSAFEALWKKAAGSLRKLSFEHRVNAIDAAREGRSGLYSLPDDWIAVVDSAGILITKEPPVVEIDYCVPLEIPGATRIEATGVVIEAQIIDRDKNEPWKNAPAEEAYLDMDHMSRQIEVRSLRPGDRMTPLGSAGSRKLQDIYTDLKVPRWQRLFLPLVISGNEIAWAAPLRISESFKVTEKTTKILHLKFLGSANCQFALSNAYIS